VRVWKSVLCPSLICRAGAAGPQGQCGGWDDAAHHDSTDNPGPDPAQASPVARAVRRCPSSTYWASTPIPAGLAPPVRGRGGRGSSGYYCKGGELAGRPAAVRRGPSSSVMDSVLSASAECV